MKYDVNELLKSVFSEEDKLDIKEAFDLKLIEYNLSKSKALKLLNVDKDVFEEIISGTAKQPNLIHVVKIGEFLDIDINNFIKAILKNQSPENIKAINNARNTSFLLKNFDVKNLTKMGFFDSSDETEVLVNKVLEFFGYDSIQKFEELLEEPLYSRSKRNFSDKMKDFWVKSAYQTFKVINNPNPYDREKLKDLIVKIKPYSQDVENGLLTVCRALYNVGITVIFQDYLSTTHVRGATFIINDRPCIVITDYLKKYPTLWFTLLHELHHVLFDFEIVKKNNFHLSGDNDLFLIEEKADSFARDFFFPEEKFQYIKRNINNQFLVNKLAKESEIHSSQIYSFFSWYQEKLYQKNYHAAFKEHYPEASLAIKKLNPLSWEDTTIKEASRKIKEILEIN
jgi:Zn-dependent peptidase ImmA (M78 family)